MEPIRPATIIAALDAVATRADELSKVSIPTLVGGVLDRVPAQELVARTLTDAEEAAALIARGELGGEAERASKLAVTLLEHAAIDEVALRDTAHRLHGSIDTIRSSPQLRSLDAREIVDTATDATTPATWSRLDTLLKSGDVDTLHALPETIDGVAPLRDVVARLASGSEASAAEFVRYRNAATEAARPLDVRRSELDELLATPLDSIEESAFGRIGTYLDADPAAPARATLDEVSGTTFANVAHRIGDGSEPLTSGVRALDELAFRRLAPEGAAAFVDKLMTRPASELTSAEWTRLATIVERDADGALAAVPRQVDGSLPFVQQAREIAAGEYAPSKYMQAYFDQYAVNRLSPEQRVSTVDALLGRDPSTLAPTEWTQLASLLDSDPNASLIKVTREINGSLPLSQQAREIAAGEYQPTRHVLVYFDRHAVDKLAPEARTAAADGLFQRDVDDLSNDEWRRLAALVESDSNGKLIKVPREVTGSKPLVTQAREIADGEYRPGAPVRAYFDRYAVDSLTPDAKSAAADALLSRDPSSLSSAEWTRLVALIDSDPNGSVIKVARQVDGSLPLAQQAREIAAGEYAPTRHMRVYFDQYAVARLSPETRTATADALLLRDPGSLSSDEWRRLAALIDADTAAEIRVPRELAGSKPLTTQAREIADGTYQPGQPVRSYFDSYAVARLEPAEYTAAADSLLSKDPDTLTEAEWTRLATLVDADTDQSLIAVPRTLDGALPLSTQARQIAAGEYRPTRYMHGYFDHYAVRKLAPAERSTAADTLLTRNPDDLSAADWRRLAALVDSDADGSLVPVARTIDGSLPLSQQAREIADGEYRPGGPMRVYFDQYAVARMPESDRLSEASALMLRPPADLSNDEWLRLAALIDADPKGTLINVPREVEGSLPLTQQAREIANGEYRPTVYMEAYFTEFARRNDPAYAAKLEAALSDVVASGGTVQSRELVAREWDRLEQIVAGRPAAEQAAIAQVMMGLDSVAASRSVKSTLELLRTNMPAAAELPANLASIRNDTMVLLERNLSRLDGVTPSDAVRGYSNHPDYAEIGRIRANMEFLHEAMRLEQAADGLTTPAAGAVGTSVASDAAAAGSATETLTW